MWIWCIVSLVILIACSILTYRLYITSNDFLPNDKTIFMLFKKKITSQQPGGDIEDVINKLKNKLKSIEDNHSYYEIQFSKFQQRLKAIEQNTGPQQQINNQQNPEEEDWKELYFEENEKKEKIENELDQARQDLEETERKLHAIEENSNHLASLKSDYDARLNDLQSMQNNIGLLQRQLEAAAEREAELEQILLSEITIKKKYAELESMHLLLQSENEDFKRQMVEMSHRERQLESRVAELNELKSRLAIHEEERSRMVAQIELLAHQNSMFSPQNNL